MRKTLDMLVKSGYPTPFHGNIVSSPDEDSDNLYTMKLKTVDIDKSAHIVYTPCNHIFTEKELHRATVRYYNEAEQVRDLPASSNSDQALGFVCVRTYINRNGVLTTRFVIRFRGKFVDGMTDSIYVGLFTAREIRRSRDRMIWYLDRHTSILRTFRRWLCSIFRRHK